MQGLLQAPLARLADDQTSRVVAHHGGAPGLYQAGVGVLAQAQVIHRPAPGFQLCREMAHGRQKQGNARLVAPDVGGFGRGLHHQDAVDGRVEAGEGGVVVAQLVAQHEDEMAHAHGLATRRRQASEQ